MSALSYEDAEWADGPKLVQWIDKSDADLQMLHGTQQRMIQRWRAGAQASFYSIDDVMVRLGLHPSMLPEDIWRQYDNGRRQGLGDPRQGPEGPGHTLELEEQRAA